jgi:hypothetical protein
MLASKQRDLLKISALTRLAVLYSIFDRPATELAVWKGTQLLGYLENATVVPEGASLKDFRLTPKVTLIADARVADLNVVRREWKRYLPSDIANIRNVMAGETFKLNDRTLHETELTTTSSSEVTQSSEQESQARETTDLASEISSQLGISINGHFDVAAEYKNPLMTTSVSGGAEFGVNLQLAEKHASRMAREAVSRAVSKTDTTTRESRVRRELTRTELATEYTLANTGESLHGIYRWVDRIDQYQVFRFPDRLLLEFQIPEPAAFYRWRVGRATARAHATEAPPDWNQAEVQAAIDKGDLVLLATKYRATNLDAPPDASQSLVATIVVGAPASEGSGDNAVWTQPAASKEVSVVIPAGYQAMSVSYSGEGVPILGKWKEWRSNEWRDVIGYHSAFATVSIGGVTRNYWNGGIQNKNKPQMHFFATHGDRPDLGVIGRVQGEEPPYGRATLPISGNNDIATPTEVVVGLGPPATGSLQMAVTCTGLSSCTVTARVSIAPTAQAMMRWKLGLLDAVYSAWSQWKKEYETSQMRQAAMTGSVPGDVSSAQAERTIREELKREVIEWLLDEPHFAGRPARSPQPPKPNYFAADVLYDQVKRDAATIRFLEQAFEWSNLSYAFYSYFWASRQNSWEELAGLSAQDPDFERFLRAGYVRVVLPARPGFDVAVHNWLQYQVPFINGRLPAPDDPLYIAIDQEIREIIAGVSGGVAGDAWTVRSATSLLYLDTAATLPLDNEARRLPVAPGSMMPDP